MRGINCGRWKEVCIITQVEYERQCFCFLWDERFLQRREVYMKDIMNETLYSSCMLMFYIDVEEEWGQPLTTAPSPLLPLYNLLIREMDLCLAGVWGTCEWGESLVGFWVWWNTTTIICVEASHREAGALLESLRPQLPCRLILAVEGWLLRGCWLIIVARMVEEPRSDPEDLWWMADERAVVIRHQAVLDILRIALRPCGESDGCMRRP